MPDTKCQRSSGECVQRYRIDLMLRGWDAIIAALRTAGARQCARILEQARADVMALMEFDDLPF